MKRFKLWLIRRLTTPQIGEVRNFGGIYWTLTSIEIGRHLYEKDYAQLTYTTQFDLMEATCLPPIGPTSPTSTDASTAGQD